MNDATIAGNVDALPDDEPGVIVRDLSEDELAQVSGGKYPGFEQTNLKYPGFEQTV